MVRWLADEVRRLSLDDVPAEVMRQGTTMPHARCGNSWPILRPGRLPDRAIVMLYRQEVLGESLEGLAAEAGISLDAIRKRRERAIRAIRAQLAA